MNHAMHWEKLGLLYNPEIGIHPKLISHAANPLPIQLEGDLYRIFYSGRDAHNRSSIGAVDVNINTRSVVYVHKKPFFEYGHSDSYYLDGVSIGNCYEADNKCFILFMGWQKRSGTHWRGDIGRLVLNTNFELELDGDEDSPFMSSDSTDPISLSYPWVMTNGHHGYHMWYGSTKSWNLNGEMLHVLNYASSHDGHLWKRHGLSVPYELGIAQAFSKPTVITTNSNSYHMWFSYRGKAELKYRIGYATSIDTYNWKLQLHNSGITVSNSGWDSEMIEYPFVFKHHAEHYMLYNGNGYGKTGFGLAKLYNEIE